MKGGGSTVNIHVFIDSTPAHAVRRAIARIDVGHLRSGQPLLVPSTGRAEDRLLALVNSALRDQGASPGRKVPPRVLQSLVRGGWTEVELVLPELPIRRVRIAEGLAGENPWIVCDVDVIAATGPFVLDVFSRYLNPLDRARLLADRERARRSAEVNLAVRPGWSIVGGHADGRYLVAATRDAVAAELFALSLSELALGPKLAVTGPWEDPVVQRAAELELGVLIPRQLRFDVDGEPGDAGIVLEHIASRIGVSYRSLRDVVLT